ncbi:cytochrome P450 family protein [Cavenderia fasciculata]|uniref:Cytochrome P450 family protein n=1 Tax=Cavenderia fasciculata TaxID=261658 RepID=F4PXP7_CACFS|nr:cytochrome P450 family protein [Cavenderia fasciculata]EGG19557.1 cytochrome P450 family protein [Cavenderia fasciculata]|eukprot:XP_004357851.1 cytochrome P450 family protein [Cavenderia fasciculata]
MKDVVMMIELSSCKRDILFNLIKKNTRFSNNDPPLACISAPIIGGLWRISKNPPEDLLGLAKKCGKIYGIWFGDNYTVFINDLQILEEAFIKKNQIFGNRPIVPSLRIVCENYNNLVLNDIDTWKPLRRFIDQSFTKTKLKALSSTIDLQSNNLIRKLKELSKDGQPVNPAPYYRKYTFSIILKMMFNVELSYEDEPDSGIMHTIFSPIDELVNRIAQGAIFDTVHILGPIYYHLYGRPLNRKLDSVRNITKQFIDQHRQTIDPKNIRDILDLFILGEYDDEIIINVFFDMLFAGVETTASTLQWLSIVMSNQPHEQELLREEIRSTFVHSEDIQPTADRSDCPQTCAVMKEILRYRMVVPFSVPRIASEDTTLGGYFIPKGTHLMGNFYALHATQFKDADQFKPSRFLDDTSFSNPTLSSQWVPFSIGPRNCLGFGLAREELQLSVAKIFHNFKISSFDGGQLDETPVHGITVAPKYQHIYKFEFLN